MYLKSIVVKLITYILLAQIFTLLIQMEYTFC